jgi:hypothetical protein
MKHYEQSDSMSVDSTISGQPLKRVVRPLPKTPMDTIALRLDPGRLANLDTDLRYELPDLICERCRAVLADDGWGYEGEPPFVVMFLRATDVETGLGCVLDVIENVRIKDNDLRDGCVVAVRRDGNYEVVYPPGFIGPFDPWAA